MIPTLQLGQTGRRIKGAGGGGGVATYLDQLATTPRAAFGVEKLISTATLCCRVRNSTSGTETDIGFSGDVIDTTALAATYTAGQSVTVAKWYDQTGNAEHFENTTAATQPLIVSAGSYLGHVSFNGTSQFLKITSLTCGTPQFGMYVRHQIISTTGTRVMWELSVNDSVNAGTFAIYINLDASQYIDSWNSGTNRARRYSGFTPSDQYTYLIDRSITGATEISTYRGGTLRTPLAEAATTEQTGNFATHDFFMGCRAGTTFFTQMAVENLVIYNADTSGIRSSIEAIVA